MSQQAVPIPPRRSPIIGDLHVHCAPDEANAPVGVLIELNTLYPGDLREVEREFLATWRDFQRPERWQPDGGRPEGGQPEGGQPDGGRPEGGRPEGAGNLPPGVERVTGRVFQVVLSRRRLGELVAFDRDPARGRPPTIFKAWPDYLLHAHIDRSAATVKADAARRTYAAAGEGVVWAVLDSGIQSTHPHFSRLGVAADPLPETAGQPASPTRGLHRDFTSLVKVGLDFEGNAVPTGDPAPLTDPDGHGTHVAGIIAGGCPPSGPAPRVASSDEPAGDQGFVSRVPTGALAGMAPACELVSLRVLRCSAEGTLVTSAAAVMRALDYIRTEVNGDGGPLRIHGVNISLGCDWDASHYAAGQSPLCQALNDLVRSGVVVVVSAGNGGKAHADAPGDTVSLLGSITEPAHAQGAIAVGSTHRDAPHVFGVTYTSAKGPTLDGRRKPDVVAPGEWITSAATGRVRSRACLEPAEGAAEGAADGAAEGAPTYAPCSGTSMAAPHVSGVIAAFLSARPEYIGRPDEVKALLCATATDLGRERYAQGHGLVDLMRMLAGA
jgi:subtilisin family serine protease